MSKNSFSKSLKKKKIPFREVMVTNFRKSNRRAICLFYFRDCTSRKILRVNPFNQPAVEEVKILTRKKLF